MAAAPAAMVVVAVAEVCSFPEDLGAWAVAVLPAVGLPVAFGTPDYGTVHFLVVVAED